MEQHRLNGRWLLPLLSAALVGCGSECLVLPCAPPNAIALAVQTSAGQLLAGASVQVEGPEQSTMPCAGSCLINGGAGVYQLTISAPGYAAVHRSVVVSALPTERCSCERVTTENLTVTLGA
jgi:hypothetical protein